MEITKYGVKTYTIFKINIEKQPLELVCIKRCSIRFSNFHRKTPALKTPWRSPWSLFWKKIAGLEPEGLQFLFKKDSNSCFPVKFVKFLRAPDLKEYLRTTACQSKSVRCIVFIKAMANTTFGGKFSFNYHLLFHYSQFYNRKKSFPMK